MNRAYINAGIGALELYANLMGSRGSAIRNAGSISQARLSAS